MSEEPEIKQPEADEERAAAWNELADLLEEAGRQSQSTENTQEIMDWLRGRLDKQVDHE